MASKPKLTNMAAPVPTDVAGEFDAAAGEFGINRVTLLRWAIHYAIRHGARRMVPPREPAPAEKQAQGR